MLRGFTRLTNYGASRTMHGQGPHNVESSTLYGTVSQRDELGQTSVLSAPPPLAMHWADRATLDLGYEGVVIVRRGCRLTLPSDEIACAIGAEQTLDLDLGAGETRWIILEAQQPAEGAKVDLGAYDVTVERLP